MLTNNIAYLGLQWLQKPHGCLLLWCVVVVVDDVVVAAAAAGNDSILMAYHIWNSSCFEVHYQKCSLKSQDLYIKATLKHWKCPHYHCIKIKNNFTEKRQEIENQAPLCLTPRCLNDLSSYLGQSAGKLKHWKQNHNKVAISRGLLFNENIWLVVMLLAHLIFPYFNFNLIYPFLVWGLSGYFSLCNSSLSFLIFNLFFIYLHTFK